MQIQDFIIILCWLLAHVQYGAQSNTTEAPTAISPISPTPTPIPTLTSISISIPTSTSTSAPSAVQTVDVGNDGFTFNPDTLTVPPGGKVEFHFFPQNHSVVQGDFSNPCHPSSGSGIFSGFVPTTSGESPDVFTVTVNDTNPIWLYCGQVGHCQAGMVGVINPPGNGSQALAAFKAGASNAVGSTVPTAVSGGIFGKPSNVSTTSSTSIPSTTPGLL